MRTRIGDNGTYQLTDTVPGVTMALEQSSVEDAPVASPTGLASLIAGLSALAYWHRRRKPSV